MRTLKFKNNDEMPALGLGTWKSKPGEVYNAVKVAINRGYRHIDCAPIYGNEKEIGQAIADCIAEGVVSRNDLWITSKLWCTDHAKDDVIPALKQTLKDLQTEYLDLFLIHWPVLLKKGVSYPRSAEDLVSLDEIPISETWKAMEGAHEMGLIKHLGVSNFGKKNLENLISVAKIKPELNQIESHPYLQQRDLFSLCKSHNIYITAYAPLGSSDRSVTRKTQNEPKLLDDAIIQKIAKSKNCTPAQILLSWALNRGISVIPKSVNPDRIAQNIEAEKLNFSDDELQSITDLKKEFRYITGQHWVFEGGPYTIEDIWA